jgi:hypothetical protein
MRSGRMVLPAVGKGVRGKIMRLPKWFLAVLVVAAVAVVGCATPRTHNLPPAEQLMHPGPGVGGPGPGVIPPQGPPMGPPMGGMAPIYPGGVVPAEFAAQGPTVQVMFGRPEGMYVYWDVGGAYAETPLVAPGRTNFAAGGIYRLKLTNIPNREGVELYPTLELGPATPRTQAYLAHNAIPFQLTDEDFDQVLTGNFVTKVIYLPDPEFQELAIAGVETLVSTRLDPGTDPITEADRRGAIMAILRLGNIDHEMPEVVGEYAQPVAFHGPAVGGGVVGGPGGGAYCGPDGGMMGGPGPIHGGMPPPFVAGVTAPQYGMPITGTPIGLPGPPHIPLGGPAGLKSHVMRNHTHINMPVPTPHVKIDVKERPGYSYPQPANHIFIREESIHPAHNYRQPHADKHQVIPSAGGAGAIGPDGLPCY